MLALVPASDCAALLLAGGFSRRMGMDKSTLRLGEKAVLCRLADAASEACGLVIVLARSEQVLPALRSDVLRLDDPPHERGEGPLWAVARGLEHAARRGAAVACFGACDMPLMNAEHFAFVRAQLSQHAAAVPVTAETSDEPRALQPLAGGVQIEPALAACERLRRAGVRSLQSLFRALDAHELDVHALPHPSAIRGCNTPSEWQALLATIPRS